MDNIFDFINKYNFRDLLYDSNYQLYLYDQYSDHEGLTKLFQYFDTKLKTIDVYLKLFMILKSNQDITSMETKPQEYFSYMKYHYLNLIQLFGYTYVGDRWDEQSKRWDGKSVKWDNYKSSGIIDPYKYKAVMRYLDNLDQKTFNIFLFIKMCKEFCYLEENLNIYVDNTSFINPTTIHIYYSKENPSILELQDLIITMQHIMPDYVIIFKYKARRSRRISNK